MRLLAALALVLLAAAPALAQNDLGSEQQTEGYGRFFGYVCAVAAAGVLLLVGVHIIKGFMAEASRGKTGPILEDVLDDRPRKPQKRELYLGEKVPDWKTANRLAATQAGLKFLSKTDKWFDPNQMTGVAREAFRAVKAALEARSAKKIKALVTPECLDGLRAEMKRLHDKGQVHVFGRVEITDVEIVHIEAPPGKISHTFTALIAARSMDYLQKEKTGEVRRGDKKTYSYQEFWTFRRSAERWLVDLIRTSSDMDTVLNAKNVLSPADLAEFTKDADPQHVREFVAR